jgi:hypothetical protein
MTAMGTGARSYYVYDPAKSRDQIVTVPKMMEVKRASDRHNSIQSAAARPSEEILDLVSLEAELNKRLILWCHKRGNIAK